MDFSGGVNHWDNCKVKTGQYLVVFTFSRFSLVLVNLHTIILSSMFFMQGPWKKSVTKRRC